MKLRYSTANLYEIAAFIAELGGLEDPTDDELDEILEAIASLDDVEQLVFLDR